MSRFTRWLLVLGGLCPVSHAFGQTSSTGWSYPELIVAKQDVLLPPVPPGIASPMLVVPPSPIPTGLPERPAPLPDPPPPPLPAPGQQHWISLNLVTLQPFAGRIGVKVWPRANDSIWVEAYLGSVLFEQMYGFGVRMQHTALEFGYSDRFMVSPGLGVHVIPQWPALVSTAHYDPSTGNSHYCSDYLWNTLVFGFADVDVSWLHDFGPRFGFEAGVKVGFAGRLSGTIGSSYPRSLTWGRDFYPIFGIYTGLRF